MSALVVAGPGRWRLQDVPRPSPGPGEVLLRVSYCGICGTDLKIASGKFQVPRLPLVIGHELAGVVVAVGARVSHVGVGQRGAIDVIVPCETCHSCRRGRPTLCEHPRELGIHQAGGMAEYVLAPARNVHPLPDTISSAAGALIEPVACALHGQDRARVALGDTVVVIGGGAQGLLHALLARLRGATRVHAIVRHQRRRERAKAVGVDLVVAAEAADPVAEILQATSGRGADVVVEASGSLSGYANVLRIVARGGRVLAHSAAPATARLQLSPFDLFQRELAIVGSFGGTGDTWPRAIELIASGRMDPTVLVDRQWELRQAPAALEELARDRGLVKGMIRVFGDDPHAGQSCGLSGPGPASTLPS
jgi:2-desacetyl-2-hydroxyethyl bacteriochlorophyllide A dehydrogenase